MVNHYFLPANIHFFFRIARGRHAFLSFFFVLSFIFKSLRYDGILLFMSPIPCLKEHFQPLISILPDKPLTKRRKNFPKRRSKKFFRRSDFFFRPLIFAVLKRLLGDRL